MKKRLILTALCAALLVAGCITVSIHPVYTDQDLTFDPALLGGWVDSEDPDEGSWTFEGISQQTYRLISREGTEFEEEFEAHLFKLGQNSFLDLYPAEPEFGSDFYKCHIVPAHSFFRVEIKKDTLIAYYFDTQWFEQAADNNELTLAHLRVNDVMILNAPTGEIQRMLLNNLDRAFSQDSMVLVRRP